MRSASKPCANASTAALSSRSMRSSNSTMRAVSPAGSTLYSSMTNAPELISAAIAIQVASWCDRLAWSAAKFAFPGSLGRNHGFRQMAWKQTAQIAAVEGDKDRCRECPLHDALLDQINTQIGQCAVLRRAGAVVPFLRTGEEQRQRFRGDGFFDGCGGRQMARRLDQRTEPTGFDAALPGYGFDVGEVLLNVLLGVAIQFSVSVGQDQSQCR